MTPSTSSITALIVAIVVFLLLYYYANLTAMASVAIAAIVGLILQGIFLGSMFGELKGLSPAQIAERVGGVGFFGLMSLIYVLIILIVLIIYAVRDRRVMMV